MESASALIDQKIKQLGDWRGQMLAQVRQLIRDADKDILEEWKWVKPTNPGTPVWSHDGIVCTGETYKEVVKLTFARGASIEGSKNNYSKLFNSSLEGNVRRAIDIREGEKIKGDKIREAAFKELIRAAVAANARAHASRSTKKQAATKPPAIERTATDRPSKKSADTKRKATKRAARKK